MPKKTYLVTLEDEEREQRAPRLPRGTHATRPVPRARILLTAAAGAPDSAIAAALSRGRATVERPRPRLVAAGLGVREARPRPGPQPQRAAPAPARLIADAWRPAPAGRTRGTCPRRAARVVPRGWAAAYAAESVRRVCNTRSARHG